MIRSRLCIAVAALAVQAREWTGVVPTFVTMLSNDAGFPALVDLLKAFPEEANNNRVRVDRRVRREFRVRHTVVVMVVVVVVVVMVVVVVGTGWVDTSSLVGARRTSLTPVQAAY